MLRKILITLATSAVVLVPFSVSASDLGSRQDKFVSTVQDLLGGPNDVFTDDPLALDMLKTSPATKKLVMRFAVDYCLAKSKGEAKKEDREQIQWIADSMKKRNTPHLTGAFRSLYITASVVANREMCP